MTLWIALTGLAAVATASVALPFLRQGRAGKGETGAVALAREQLAELKIDTVRGLIGDEEARTAQTEIKRRLLAAAKAGETQVKDTDSRTRLVGLAIATGWVVLGSVLLYGQVGRPDLPSGVAMARAPLAEPPRARAATSAQTGGVDEAISALAARLKDNPNDAEGWRMLGWSYFQTDNYTASVEAYQKAVDLDGSDPVIFSVLGEAMVRSGGGEVTEAALAVFHKALALDPIDPRARFFQGMALEQRGDPEGAIRLWAEILETAPGDADWAPGLRDRIDSLANQIGFDLALVNLPPRGKDLLPPRAAPGPTAEQVRAAGEMSAEDRQAMILGMIEGLAARLEDAPNDPEGWQRLIRSYMVLGDAGSAAEALSRARAALGADSAAFQSIETAAADMGVR